MSILYFFIFLLVAFSLLRDFDKTVVYYAPFKLILHRGICIYDASFEVIFDMLISIVAFLVFFTRSARYKKSDIPKFIMWGAIAFCVGVFVHGMHPRFAFNIFFYEPIATFSYVYVLFKVVRTKNQLSKLIKGFMIVGAILIFDAVLDVIFDFNIITEIEKTQQGDNLWISDNDVNRAGMIRTTSFMPHSIAMGTIAVFIWGIVIVMMLRFPKYLNFNRSLLYLTVVGLPVCMLFANSRTTILTALCFAPFFLKRSIMFSRKGFILLVGLVALVFANSTYFEWMYNSIFNESSVEVGGSTTDLRDRQLAIAMFYFFQNPLTGMGVDFNVLDYENKYDAMGMESVWFTLFMLQGLVGVVTYVYFIFTGFVSFFKYNKSFWVFTLAWLVNITLSSQEGVSMFLYCIFILLSYKLYYFENNTQIEHGR